MSQKPVYVVTPQPDVRTAVHIATFVEDSPYCDESEPVILHAVTPDALPLLQSFLSGLSINKSWVVRESRGTAHIKEATLSDGKTKLLLQTVTNSKRPRPTEWFCITQDNEASPLELNLTDYTLAKQMFEALVTGALRLTSAEPLPVEP